MFQPADFAAIAFCLGLLVALTAWIVVAWRRTGHPLPLAVLYLVNTLFTRVLWRTKVSGRMPVRNDQGAIIVCNHRSGIDPLLIQLSTGRLVHWLVAREYIEAPSIAWAFRILRSIPVNRGGVDTASTKMALRLAREGGLVGLFPEGRINLTPKLLLPGRPGAALIALRARVPVVPCYVSGSPYGGTALSSFRMAAKASVVIGEPLDISKFYGHEGDRSALEELTKEILIAIARLAGVEDFEPEIAGRQWKPIEEPASGVA